MAAAPGTRWREDVRCDRELSDEMGIKQGWNGRFYEDFEVGDVYQHHLGRTILAADNTWFSLLTMNTNPAHFDYHYSAKTEFGKPLVRLVLDAGNHDGPIGHRSDAERICESGMG
jgi:hypothetical protein